MYTVLCVPALLIKRLYVCSGCPVGSGRCNDYEILEEPESEGESQLYLFVHEHKSGRKETIVSEPHSSRSQALILTQKWGISFSCE